MHNTHLIDVHIASLNGSKTLVGLEYTEKLQQQIEYLASLGLTVTTWVSEYIPNSKIGA